MKRIVYKDGTTKDVPEDSAWEYENDPDYKETVDLAQDLTERNDD